MRRLYLFGAFDRFNFGDLLFPRVTRFALEREGLDMEMACVSTRSVDLRPRGGVETRALSEVLREGIGEDSVLLAAGGDVLSARWTDACRHLGSPSGSLALKLVEKALGPTVSDALARRRLGEARPLPWVLSAGEAGGARVAYSGVGGSGLGRLGPRQAAWVRERLAEASFLSVRDAATRDALTEWGLSPKLVPDPAVLMAEEFPFEDLASAAGPESRALLKRFSGGYAAVQLGRWAARGGIETVAGQLRRLAGDTGLGILLVPLGQAAGHEDGAALGRLSTRLGGVEHALAPAHTVEDSLALLAHARLFAGTSLHGNLAALAYGVPRVGLGPHLQKLDSHLRTWDTAQPLGACPWDELSQRALEALAAPASEREAVRREVLSRARDHFRELAAALG